MGKKIIFSVVLGLLIFSFSIAFSFAWFAISESFFPDVSGDSVTGYFKDGDGSPEDPYIIESPTHVYNLAWLQYIGLLNQETTDSEGNPIITQYYFKISDEIDVIDMDGVVIPPIGTKDKPFVGHFDGNGKCISNLTVSNYLADGENEFGIEKRPLSVTTIEEDVSIVGFFGVVGALDEKTKKKLADDSEIENIEEKVNAVYDLFLDNLTVRTETDRSLIGLFAGYVNGSVTNVGIGTSSIAVGEDTTPLTAEDAFNMQLTISAYSLIGKYDETNVVWVDKPTGGSGGGSDVGGSGAGWGGSINMYDLIRRASYMFTENMMQSTKNTYPVTFYNDSWNSYAFDYKYTNTGNQKMAYIAANSVIPLNVDTETMFAGDDIKVNNYPTNTYYSTHSNEIVTSNNTGYIVGGGSGSSAWVRLRIQSMANGTYGGIYKSIGTAKTTAPSFSRSNFEMLTIDADGNVYVIKDDLNSDAKTGVSGTDKKYTDLGFKQYETVVSSFADTMTGKTMVYGLRFDTSKTANRGIVIENNKVTSATTIADVSFFGKDYADYELIDGAINFKVKSSGLITTIAGTFAAASGNHSFFNLIEVKYDSSNRISSARVITDIWVKYSGTEIVDIQYNNDLADTTGYKKVYSEANMNSLASTQTAYYFEIPVKAGDYALGTLKGTNYGAYLMYLDIGANGDQTPDGGDDGPTTVPAHKMTAVTFIDSAAIANKTTADYSVITFEVNIGSGISEHDGLTMNFNRTSQTQMLYSQNDPSSAFTVTLVKDDAQLSVEKVQNMSIADFQKNRYFRRRETEI